MPSVSVIIPTYNKSQMVCDAIESVLNQTYKDFEIIVIDDGSTDDTKQKLSKYRDKIIYYWQTNKGLSNARNKGIEISKGEFIALLDHDDMWFPDKLQKQMKLFENKKVGLVYSNAIVIDEAGNILGFSFDSSIYKPYRGNVLENLFWWNIIPCSSVIFKKELLLKAGLFDPTLTFSEEYDLFLRFAKICEFDYVDEALIKSRHHQDRLSLKDIVSNNLEVHNVISKLYNENKDLFPERIWNLRFHQTYFEIHRAYLRKKEYYIAKVYLKKSIHHKLTVKSLVYYFLIVFRLYTILKNFRNFIYEKIFRKKIYYW